MKSFYVVTRWSVSHNKQPIWFFSDREREKRRTPLGDHDYCVAPTAVHHFVLTGYVVGRIDIDV